MVRNTKTILGDSSFTIGSTSIQGPVSTKKNVFINGVCASNGITNICTANVSENEAVYTIRIRGTLLSGEVAVPINEYFTVNKMEINESGFQQGSSFLKYSMNQNRFQMKVTNTTENFITVSLEVKLRNLYGVNMASFVFEEIPRMFSVSTLD